MGLEREPVSAAEAALIQRIPGLAARVADGAPDGCHLRFDVVWPVRSVVPASLN